MGFEGKTDGEILVQYHPDDPLGMFVGWGFVSENEPFACSLSLGVDKKGPPFRIMRKEVNLELRPKPFMPDVTREGDTLVLSFLMLGNRNNPQLPRAIFDHVVREAGRMDAVPMFDFIQHVNRLQWLKLMKASELAAVPLGQLLRNLARSQLEAMSYNVGGLQFQALSFSVPGGTACALRHAQFSFQRRNPGSYFRQPPSECLKMGMRTCSELDVRTARPFS